MAKCKWYKKNVLFCGRQSIAIFPFVMAGLNFDVKIDITRCYGSVFGQKELLFNYNNIALGHLAVNFSLAYHLEAAHGTVSSACIH